MVEEHRVAQGPSGRDSEPSDTRRDHQAPAWRGVDVPLFVMGCPGSGNNLVALILNAHSRISVFLGTHYYPLFAARRHLYGDLGRPANTRRLVRDFLETLRVRDLGVDLPTTAAVMAELPTLSFEGVLIGFLRAYARRSGKPRTGERTSKHFLYLAEILDRYPGSPIVYTVRDPRDVAHFLSRSLGESLRGITDTWNRALEHYRRASRPVHLVRFEDLVTDPVRTVAGICAFLEEEFEPGMLEFHRDTPTHFYRIGHHRKLASALDPGAVGTYEGLNPAALVRVESACAAGMVAMGYAPSMADASRPAASEASLDGSGGLRRARFSRRARELVARARYYGTDATRWRVALTSWKIALRSWARHVTRLGR